MGCNTPNCGQGPTAGSGQATAVPQDLTDCQGFGYCDDKLLGLPKAASNFQIVGVPSGDKCLKRLSAGKGVWLRDAQGNDYVGGLDQIVVTGAGKQTNCGLIPAWVTTTDATGKTATELVIANPTDKAKGTLAALNSCGTNGGLRHDRIIPAALSGCPANLYLLSFQKVTEVVDGQEVVSYQWFEQSSLKLPGGQIPDLSGADLTDTVNYRLAVWHKSGDCWILKKADGSVYDGLCELAFKTLSDEDPLNVLACTTDGLRRVLLSSTLLRRILGSSGLTRIDPVLITRQKAGTGIGDVISGSASGTVNVVDDHDFPAEATIAWVRVESGLANTAGSTNHILATATLNGEVVTSVSVDESSSGDVDRMALAYPVKLTDGEFTFSTSLSVTDGLNGGCYSEIKLIGYE